MYTNKVEALEDALAFVIITAIFAMAIGVVKSIMLAGLQVEFFVMGVVLIVVSIVISAILHKENVAAKQTKG